MDDLVFLSRDAQPSAYDIRDLGLLEDGRLCEAYGVNSHGHVVGEADAMLGVHGVVWRAGLLEDLGTLGGTVSRAIAINDDGHIVGTSEVTPAGKVASFLKVDDKVINLDKLGIPGAGVKAINNAGRIVGEMEFEKGRPASAFTWLCGAAIEIVGKNVDGSCAEAINEYGQVAGHLSSLKLHDQAFFWQQGEIIDLGLGRAYGINDHGAVVGMTYQGGLQPQACFWREFRRREIPLTIGTKWSCAYAVNNGLEIVGDMGGGELGDVPFLWKNEYMMDLNDLIDPLSGWKLHSARAINNAGQIVGWGFKEHRHHGFILTPYERKNALPTRMPPPQEGAEAVEPPDYQPEGEESLSFQDMIMKMVQQDKNK